MSSHSVLVINPNSNAEVTAALDQALDVLRRPSGPEILCRTISEGPAGVESQEDFDRADPLVQRLIAAEEKNHSAFVVACYSDPGVRAARALTRKPVFGIAESALATAIQRGLRPGVISILEASVARHWSHAKALHLAEFIASDIAIGLSVKDLADESTTLARLLNAAHRLRDDHKADVIVLGCAGMARYRAKVSRSLGIPVLDPTQVAVGAAILAIELDL